MKLDKYIPELTDTALTHEVLKLARALQIRTRGTTFVEDAKQLAEKTESLVNEIKIMQTELAKLQRTTIPSSTLSHPDKAALPRFTPIDKNWEHLQSENHEQSSNLKDVLKALFMWRDEPQRQNP